MIKLELTGGSMDGKEVDISGDDISNGRLTIMYKTAEGETYFAKNFHGKVVLFFKQDRRIK